MLNPVIIGTEGILEFTKAYALTMEKVVITSLSAAIKNPNTHLDIYSKKKNWYLYMYKDGLVNLSKTYCAYKMLVEKAVWEFLDTKKPNFTVTTVCPPCFGSCHLLLLQPG
jgi:hypothetical protein